MARRFISYGLAVTAMLLSSGAQMASAVPAAAPAQDLQRETLREALAVPAAAEPSLSATLRSLTASGVSRRTLQVPLQRLGLQIVPEPGSLLLCGLGLVALGGASLARRTRGSGS